ncbi:hypothetical protein [Absidia glauca]|uniref:Translation initiation factor eIF2B subunit epsilon n=1 Tax=Absidia glauca TaxID=4829 RepID=A0A168R2A4_ABSGL|nr:hypothetical protein [Absidia glauca]
MPPKNKRQQQGDGEVEEPLQAVILTDSYDDRFLPISHEVPRCLMPLCNIPLIEYTLEVLAISDVRDVFVVCTSHIEKIKAYFEQSTWMNSKGKLNVKVVQTPDVMSVGDALRELDARQLITNDFILTSGDLVSNIKLDKAIEAHRARKKTDKNAIMTMVVKEASRSHTSRPQEASSVFVLDPKSSKCLFYEPVAALPKKSRIEISPEVLENHHQIEFRNDLVDPRVDICSLEVPALFTENFDWQRLRRDFVHGILTSDILGKTIYTHLVSEAYIAHIQNERIYNTVSMHVLNRWVFPIVPETNLKPGDDYEFMSGNIYKSRDVILSRSCIVDENVQIGAGTVIGENSRVANSIIGRNCQIGANVTLVGVYLWDGVVIGNNCTVTKSILANNASVLENTTIEQGCLLSPNVVIGPNDAIHKYSRLSLHPQPKTSMFDSDEEDEEENGDVGRMLTGDHEPVYFWSEIANDDDDEDVRNLKLDTLEVFMQWGPLIGKVTHKPDDQVHVLSLLQKHCASTEALGKLFMGALQILYNIDVVEEEAVMEWYTSDISKSGSPAEVKLREKAAKFVEWLNEAEEESEEDSDDE